MVVSIFVNPKQFGPAEDFAKYPRRAASRHRKLGGSRDSVRLHPGSGRNLPAEFFDLRKRGQALSERLEGRIRPGHFRGVSTVVLKLLQIVQPHFAYFGRKDAQQAAIISRMASDLNLDAEIVVCPLVREADGLAMSSRNAYLDADDRHAGHSFVPRSAGRPARIAERHARRASSAIRHAPRTRQPNLAPESTMRKLWTPRHFNRTRTPGPRVLRAARSQVRSHPPARQYVD